MHELLERILRDGPVLTDAAWGTQLQDRGLPIGHCPDEWNLSHPELVEQVAGAYVDAGSRIILTNTFRANCIALAGSDLESEVVALNREGAQISVRASAGRAHVFGSIGPSGQMLCTGQVTESDLLTAFTEQAEGLVEGGVDAIVIETMADLAEAKVALAAARPTGLPVVVCAVFDSGKDLDRTMMGNTVEQVAQELTDAGADVIGANCGQGIASFVEICRRLHAATERPIWIKANAGVPQMDGEQVVYETTAAEFAEHGSRVFAEGASFLGGCCGTGPEHIQALCKRCDK
ncbi:MAG: methionine synthase [Fuerstiella sp.]|nr:methionine synthase [Fuerstiella sp.]MCP4857843.1 methionine synthase [Fuerstiella sp.]